MQVRTLIGVDLFFDLILALCAFISLGTYKWPKNSPVELVYLNDHKLLMSKGMCYFVVYIPERKKGRMFGYRQVTGSGKELSEIVTYLFYYNNSVNQQHANLSHIPS